MLFDHRWPGHPTLLPDETFSSWFARTAAANGLAPIDLYRAALPGAYRYTHDIDRYIEPPLLDSLAERTGVSRASLFAGTLGRWAGRVFDTDDGRSKLPWLPVAGSDGGLRSYGQQVCPACLCADASPHLRAIWRLSFVTACPHHRLLLIDRCPHCGEAIQVLRSGIGDTLRCWKCRADLAQAPQDHAGDGGAIERQRHLLDIVSDGWVGLGAYGPVYAFVYFRILMLVFRLLVTGRHAVPLRAWVDLLHPSGGDIPATPRIRQVELLNPRCRHALLRMATFLVEDWPARFVSAAEFVGLSSRDLLKSGRTQPYPFAFDHAVEWNLSSQFREMSPEEVESVKSVLRARSVAPTYRALAGLVGVKSTAARALAEPATDALPPGEGRYWKLDGVSPEVKIAARKAALRAGERIGPWLDTLLRRELNLSARKIPPNSRSADTVAVDGIIGCEE